MQRPFIRLHSYGAGPVLCVRADCIEQVWECGGRTYIRTDSRVEVAVAEPAAEVLRMVECSS